MSQDPRKIAAKVLLRATENSTYSNIALDNILDRYELSDSDRGLLTAIVMGVTERRLTLDRIIDSLAARADRIDDETRILLRIGIYQIVYLDRIPDHAAVNETVNLAPRRSRGFVNAILRSLLRLRDGEGLDRLFPDKESSPVEYLSEYYSFPTDICEKFIQIYGYKRAESMFEVFNSAPKLTLRINTLKISRDEYAKLLVERDISFSLSERLGDAILLWDTSFAKLPGFDEGYFFVQDEASQMCVEALGAESGELVIDCCSCPGSKSFGSAIRMKNCGEVRCFDLHQSKLGLIDSGARRLGIDIISAAVRDGRQPDDSLFARADRVLCDVPCSGLGVIAKKPEIRYKRLEDITRLPEIQYDILEKSSQYVRHGGVLVYSTCTVLPEENQVNVERFLAEHTDFEPLDFQVGGRESREGMLSLSPDTDGTDGFFISKMIRKQ